VAAELPAEPELRLDPELEPKLLELELRPAEGRPGGTMPGAVAGRLLEEDDDGGSSPKGVSSLKSAERTGCESPAYR
jgi:hypothetical protein